MKEPMKCERIIQEWETHKVEGYDEKENAVQVKTYKHKKFCGGELEEKRNDLVTLEGTGIPKKLYQCKLCKDVTIK